jgi:DNA-binding transcriptional regulator YdaS (Cro superfamily)
MSDSKTIYTHQEVIDIIKANCERAGSQAKCAAWLNVRPATLSRIISGKRGIGPDLLAKMGFTEIRAYRLRPDAPRTDRNDSSQE